MKFTMMNLICRPKLSDIKYLFLALLRFFCFETRVVLNQILFVSAFAVNNLTEICQKILKHSQQEESVGSLETELRTWQQRNQWEYK